MAYVATLYVPDEHRSELEVLWRAAFDPPLRGDIIEARMRWLYDENPEGPPTTFLVRVDETQEVIACATCLPRAVRVHGERVRAGILCDFAVAKRHRTAGAAIAVQRALAKSSYDNGYRFLFGFPNEGAVAVCKRVGYQTVGATRTWVKLLRSGTKLRLARARFIEGPLSYVVDAGIAAFDRATSRLVTADLETEELSAPDERFDRLWERAHPRRGISGERSASYLGWRYARFTTDEHAFMAIKRRGASELSGYAVYSIDGDRAIVQDLFAVDFERTADALLVALAISLRERGLSSLVVPYLGPASFGARLRRLGFFRRPGDRTLVVYSDARVSESERRELASDASWFIFDGELDI